jgi:hypothetical protein
MPHSLTHSGYSPGEPTEEVDYISSDPNQQLGFEISPATTSWSFAPEFYPDDFTQMKKKELSRYGGNCGGESVSIKAIKNREFHVTGVLLQGEINIFQGLLDYDKEVDLLSPLTPAGGMECYVKQGELGNQNGWDPHTRQWMFKFTLDLVSTGRDEHDTGNNEIVTAIIDDSDLEEAAQRGSL